MSQISVQNLTFAYEGSYDNVFENVSFRIDTDWRLGFTGRNGRGKTTFLNLLRGKFEYAGTISHSVEFDYFPFEVEDDSIDTLLVAERICPEHARWQLVRELSLLETDESILYRPFSTLSNGERIKLLLAALFLKKNNFLLIDEPTNHLDLRGREVVSAYLSRKSGFILVSHDRAFLDGCVDHILAINKCDIEVVQGNFSSWYRNRQLQDMFELNENDKLKKEISRLEKTSREKAGWSDKVERTKFATRNSGIKPDKGYIGHKAAKMMGRAKAIEDRRQQAIEEKSGLLKNLEAQESLKISQLAYHSSRLLLLNDVSISYGSNAVCRNVSFTIERGDRIALAGKNGSGKSSVIKLICGEGISYAGDFQLGSRLKISYVSQNTSSLRGSLTDFAIENGVDESLFKAILRKLDFSREQFDVDMRNFSDGQKKKALIAKSLCEKAHLLIWDEPLNFIDVISRMQIEKLLLECKPTILFVEHDRMFCENIATKTVQL